MTTKLEKYLDVVPSDREVKIEDPAITYPFSLDNFQKQAQYYIQKSENVLITAHTSAGKTVVAEAGVAFAKKRNKRAFYTSPIKTLSNQKFHEFSQKFGDVGLLTGDIKCKPDAQCVIMTTEILRDMLYKEQKTSNYSQDALKNLDCVIFDEVHYINNPERGHVWEEVLCQLPKDVTLIMLSATISEAEKFAEWIGQLKQRPIHLITTMKRPVPLNHYAYIGDRLYQILDEKQNFYESNYRLFHQNYNQLAKKPSFNAINLLNPFITFLDRQKLNPAIFFVFSRKKCQQYASKINVILTSGEEQCKIANEIDKNVVKQSLKKDVLEKIPQFQELKALLIRGIGVHHSGLMPVLKEIVEILFSQGLIRVLFATETFCVGINMPARTVIFTNLYKYCDGSEHPRLLKPDEYLQMSGRAGRRGLDKCGTVIYLPLNDVCEPSEIGCLLQGKSGSIESKFKINYAFILQMLTNGIENVSNQSYLSQQDNEKIIGLKQQIKEIEKKIEKLGLETLNLTSEQKAQIQRLIEIENRKTTPTMLGEFVVRMDKKKEKNLKTELTGLYRNLDETLAKNLNEIKIKYNDYEQLKKQLDNLGTQIEYYQVHMTQEYRSCSEELIEMGYLAETCLQMPPKLTDRGLMASCLISANEILLTELVKQERIQDLDTPSLSAILSLFCEESRGMTDDENEDKGAILPTEVETLVTWIDDLSEHLKGKYHFYSCKSPNRSFLNVAYLWAQGKTYFEITPYLLTYEGNFIRNMLRLTHICDELIKVCEIHPNTKNGTLEKKLIELKTLLVRDIVTFDSLYLKA